MTLAVCSLNISKYSQTFALLLFLAAYKAPQSFIFVFFSPSVCLFVYFLRICRLLEFFLVLRSWRKYMAWLCWDDMR